LNPRLRQRTPRPLEKVLAVHIGVVHHNDFDNDFSACGLRVPIEDFTRLDKSQVAVDLAL